MKKNEEKSGGRIFRVLSLIFILILVLFASFYLFLFVRCFGAEEKIGFLKECAIMRVELYGSSAGTVSARLALLDTSGKEFAVLDRSWRGDVLSVDFSSASFGERTFLFPVAVSSARYLSGGDRRTYRGTPLSRYYLYDGECAFLDSSFSKKSRRALYDLASFAIWQSSKFRSSYSSVTSLDLSALERGITYEIYADFSSGSLRLSRT